MTQPVPNPILTIAYVTARMDNKIEWFMQSLLKQIGPRDLDLLIIDHYHEVRSKGVRYDRCVWITEHGDLKYATDIRYSAPKPNVWNGPHRLTNQEWFAMASARNTAICLCKTPYLAFVDDLSVLMPGWLEAVFEAIEGKYVGLGAYKKVGNLKVEDGIPVHFYETESGMDDRLRRVTKDVSECDGGWCYGCSLVAPLEAFLSVGGFPEICDGLGSEDYCLGIALKNSGWHLKYDRRMMTLESEELHFKETPFRRTDKGVSPNDKSHAVLNIAKQSTFYPNYFGGGIRALREYVRVEEHFPIVQIPTHDWYDGQPITEMI